MQQLHDTFIRYGFPFVSQFLKEYGINCLPVEDIKDPGAMIVQFNEKTIVAFKFELSFDDIQKKFNHYLTLV